MGDEALKVAQADPKKFFSRYGRQAKKSENFGGNTRDTGFTNMIDLGDFAQRTATRRRERPASRRSRTST